MNPKTNITILRVDISTQQLKLINYIDISHKDALKRFNFFITVKTYDGNVIFVVSYPIIIVVKHLCCPPSAKSHLKHYI